VATATRNLTVLNLMGLHVRPITTIVLLLKKHGAKASIHVAGEDVACDSMALMIAADKFPQGTEISVTVTHENPEPIADELAAAFAAKFNVPGD
jgi:phosphotransferase system HPr (HPr) family protein